MDSPMPDWIVPRWRDFLATEHPSGLDVYDDLFKTDLAPLQRKRELGEMMRRARALNPKCVMEIGADKGGSLYHWCKSLPSVERVVAIEYRGCPYAAQFRAAFPKIEFLFIEGSSYAEQAIRNVDFFIGTEPFDCIFIDGDKNAFNRDFASYGPLVRKGGIIFCHDVLGGAPCAKWFDGLQGFRKEKFIDTTEHVEAVVRQSRGDPVDSSHEDFLRYWSAIPTCGLGMIYID